MMTASPALAESGNPADVAVLGSKMTVSLDDVKLPQGDPAARIGWAGSHRGKWRSVDGSRTVSAAGSFAWYPDRVNINGYLKDSRRDRYAAGIDFLVAERGEGIIQPLTLLKRRSRKPNPGPGKAKFDWTTAYNDGFWVRECLVKVSKPYKRTCGRWKKIF
ncbi:hypothetical protein [Actinomadura terrae]|uniref:hypothetical protein n=1 Tax=Actinomadura terrae TaxID=604353 RepID=UPI001FA7FCCC|nr:hypothetical protein [Actinomadura terrae]